MDQMAIASIVIPQPRKAVSSRPRRYSIQRLDDHGAQDREYESVAIAVERTTRERGSFRIAIRSIAPSAAGPALPMRQIHQRANAMQVDLIRDVRPAR